ncbi:MAG TPA: hypothetical protein H9740_06850 [Candidatus Hungatella pullicola]|nr:hypothetical protein [Candidatus Hungatella pullicola]
MDVIAVMCIGVLVGNKLFCEKYKKVNEILQLICTLVLIFSMGAVLGRRADFIAEITSLGWTSFLLFLIPTGCSVLLVYVLTKRFLKGKEEH